MYLPQDPALLLKNVECHSPFSDIDNAKSYATEENLWKALRKYGLADMRPR